MKPETLATRLRNLAVLYSKVQHLDKESIQWYLENAEQFDLNNFAVSNDNTVNKFPVKL